MAKHKLKGNNIKICFKKEDKSVRDDWIPKTWSYNGAGFEKNKKAYNRKKKHKNKDE